MLAGGECYNARMIGIGVIGAGRIGRVHALNLFRSVGGARLQAVSDINLEAARALASEAGGAQALADHRPMLGDGKIEAIVICSSTDTHARLIEEAAAAGKHVFCEKPIDLEISAIRRALAAVDRHGVRLQVGFNRRFDAQFKRVAELVRRGEVGSPQLVRITSRDPQPPPSEYIRVSGGLFLDMAIHDFDMARFVIQDEIEEVYAAGAVLVDPEIGRLGDVDTALITLRYKGGAIGAIDNSRRAAYGYDQRVEVFGSGGCAKSSNVGPNGVEHWGPEGSRKDPPHHFFIERYAQAYRDEMQAFVDSLRDKAAPPVGGEDGLQAVLLGLAAKKSFQEKRPVRLSELA